MLLRRGTLTHPNGHVVDLPLLIPSFTSKGFGFFTDVETTRGRKGGKDKKRYSQSDRALQWVGSFPQPSLLISAYDIFHEHYKSPLEHLKNAELVFLDSGGYELSPEFDSTEPREFPHAPKEFTLGNYLYVLDELY